MAGPSAMREWKSQGGVAITRVAPGSPAARAGLEEGMIVVEANGRRLRNYLDWEAVKLDLHVTDTVTIKVKRRLGPPDTHRIITRDLPSVAAAKVSVIHGLELTTVTPAIQAERGLVSERGVLIYRVTREVREATGLQEGDVIVSINRTLVTSTDQVATLLESMGSGQVFTITFERQGSYAYTSLAFR